MASCFCGLLPYKGRAHGVHQISISRVDWNFTLIFICLCSFGLCFVQDRLQQLTMSGAIRTRIHCYLLDVEKNLGLDCTGMVLETIDIARGDYK
jgi:hypothetical protein